MAKVNKKGKLTTTNATQELKTEVDLLSKQAQSLGYRDIMEYSKEEMKSWDHFSILDAFYNKFMEAVMNKLPKSYGKRDECWGNTSTFENFCNDSVTELTRRLEELAIERDEKPLAYREILDSTDTQSEGSGFTNAAPGLGHRADSSDYEFYNEIMRKTIETLKLFLQGKLNHWNSSREHIPSQGLVTM